MFSRILSVALGAVLIVRAPAPAAQPARAEAAQELQDLLAASRGVAPSLCTLAADGMYSWGGSRWYAPAEAITSDVRTRLRLERKRRLTSDESRALLQGIAST